MTDDKTYEYVNTGKYAFKKICIKFTKLFYNFFE